MEVNGYINITADSYEDAAKVADDFEIKMGLSADHRTVDYNLALDIGASITNNASSAQVELGFDSGALSTKLLADTEGRKSIMIGVKFELN